MIKKYVDCLRSIRALRDNGGSTWKNGAKVIYKTGYMVATDGIATKSRDVAIKVHGLKYFGTCGWWYKDGVYYIDNSHHIKTKREALAIGRAHNQQSIYDCKNKCCIDC